MPSQNLQLCKGCWGDLTKVNAVVPWGGGRRQEPGARRQEAGGRRQEAGARRQEAGGRSQEAGARRQEPGGRRQEPGARRQEAGGRSTPVKEISGKEDTPGRGAEPCAPTGNQNSAVFLWPELS